MQRAFSQKAVAINALRKEPVTLDEASRAFKQGFEKGLGIQLVPYQLSESEEKEVQLLAKSRYESDEWNFRR